MGEPVGRAHHELVKGELGVKLKKLLFGVLFLILLHLLLAEDKKRHRPVEQLLHGVLNIVRAAPLDDILSEGRRGIEDELVLRQFHHLGVVKIGRDKRSCEVGFQIAKHLGPNVTG